MVISGVLLRLPIFMIFLVLYFFFVGCVLLFRVLYFFTDDIVVDWGVCNEFGV